jgi:predicted TIM-barrel fold metal-dependent hydrolase
MAQFFGLPFRDEVRRKILWDNCARLYNVEAPKDATRVSTG